VAPGESRLRLDWEIEAESKIIQFAQQHGVRMESLTTLGNFWRAREQVSLEVRSGSGG
jgi:hypothetical protein